MKKPITIVLTLIILAMIIGFEHIGRGLDFLISDSRKERTRASQITLGDSEEKPLSRPLDDRPESLPNPANSSEPPGLVTEQASRGENNFGGRSLAINVTADLSPLHFIRSAAITRTSTISEIERETLRQAVEIIGDGLNPRALIFDADALTTSEAPFILFGRDGFDLTPQVKIIYERLRSEALSGGGRHDGAGRGRGTKP
jgi:hypothetical protein